jgi:hypothetical protein
MVISNTIHGHIQHIAGAVPPKAGGFAAEPPARASGRQLAGAAATPSCGADLDGTVRCDGTTPCEFPLGAVFALPVRDALDLAALPLTDVLALVPDFVLEVPVVPLPFWLFRLVAALLGFADVLRVVRAAVDADVDADVDAAGLALAMPLLAAVSDFTAVSIALVAELMACIAAAIDLAEVVAFVTASFSFVVAAVTLVVAAVTLAAADEMSRGAAVVLVLLVVATDLPSS